MSWVAQCLQFGPTVSILFVSCHIPWIALSTREDCLEVMELIRLDEVLFQVSPFQVPRRMVASG